MELEGRVIIVTGGGAGLGRRMTLGFVREGANVVVAEISMERAAQTVEEARAVGGTAIAVETDVSRTDSVNSMVQRCVDEFGTLDVLVNNAALTMTDTLIESVKWRFMRTAVYDLPVEVWDRMISVNLSGVFYCIKAALPIMMEKKQGSIINLSSRSGTEARLYQLPYVATKHGIQGITKALTWELKPYNIAINSLTPGWRTDTSGTGKGLPPNVIVPAAIFLAKQDGTGMTGQFVDAERYATDNKITIPTW